MSKRVLLLALCMLLTISSHLAAGGVASEGVLPVSKQPGEALLSDADFEAQILPLVEARIGLPDSLTEMNHLSYEGYGNTDSLRQHSIRWQTPSTNYYDPDAVQIVVNCDDTGRIFNYDRGNNGDWNSTDWTRISLRDVSDVKEKAFAFITRLCPDIADQLASEPRYDYQLANTYSVNDLFFPRLVNGVPTDNGVGVSYDFTNDRVFRFTRTWDDQALFDTTTPVLNEDDLDALLTERMALRPVYMMFLKQPYGYQDFSLQSSNPKAALSEPQLIYAPVHANDLLAFAAQDGSILPADPYAPNPRYGRGSVISLLYARNATRILDPSTVKKRLSEAELEAKVRAMPELFFPADATLRTDYPFSYNRNLMTERNQVTISWEGPNIEMPWGTSRAFYCYAILDLESGELLSYEYNYSGEAIADHPRADADALQNHAETFLQKYAPRHFESSRSQGLISPSPYFSPDTAQSDYGVVPWSYTRVRLIHDIEYLDNLIELQLDAHTGKIVSYNLLWQDDLVLPKPQYTLSLTEAEKLVREHFAPQLSWHIDSEHRGQLYFISELFPWLVVDSQDGIIFLNSGRRLPYQSEPLFSDLKDYPERRAIERAFLSGWLAYTDHSFHPTATMTQGEFVEMISPLCREHAYDGYVTGYDYLVQHSALARDEIDATAAITQGEALRIFLTVQGFGEIAAMTDTFVTTPGVTPELHGYIAIAQSLGLLRQDFQVNQPLTRIQAGAMIANLLCRP